MTRKPTARPSHLKALETPIAVDGKKIATELLAGLDEATRSRIMGEMREREPGLTREIEGRLVTLLKVLDLPHAQFDQVWREFPEHTWCLALRGATTQELDALKKHLSARASTLFFEALQSLGAQPKSKIDEARRLIVNFAKTNFNSISGNSHDKKA